MFADCFLLREAFWHWRERVEVSAFSMTIRDLGSSPAGRKSRVPGPSSIWSVSHLDSTNTARSLLLHIYEALTVPWRQSTQNNPVRSTRAVVEA